MFHWFTLFSALTPRAVSYPLYFIFNTFFLIITATKVNVVNVCFWFELKRLQRISIWYLIFTEITFIGAISFFHVFFLHFSVLFPFFLSLLIKRILLSSELIKMLLPLLTLLKYVHTIKKRPNVSYANDVEM